MARLMYTMGRTAPFTTYLLFLLDVRRCRHGSEKIRVAYSSSVVLLLSSTASQSGNTGTG